MVLESHVEVLGGGRAGQLGWDEVWDSGRRVVPENQGCTGGLQVEVKKD